MLVKSLYKIEKIFDEVFFNADTFSVYQIVSNVSHCSPGNDATTIS